jgi:hypothetical protein
MYTQCRARRQEWRCLLSVGVDVDAGPAFGREARGAGKGGACAVLVALHLRVGDMAVRGASAAVLRNAGTAAKSQVRVRRVEALVVGVR